MSNLGIITVGRSDFSILHPLMLHLENQGLAFKIFASTAHFSKEFGHTANEIFQSFDSKNIESVDTKISVSTNSHLAASIAKHVLLFSQKFKKHNIKSIVLIGDRYETFAAATAATSMMIDIIHLHGGVITLGSMDNAFRNAITEMSQYHFVDNKKAEDRLIKKGIENSRVFFLGSLAVENFVNSKKMSDEDFYQEIFKTDQSVPFAVATYHPSTKILEDDKKIVMNIIKSVTSKKIHLLFTFPNADLNNAHIIKVLIKESKKNKFLTVKKNLGGLLYNSALKKSIFMVGNSSSGIIESSACKTPSINIGSRQDGRDMNLNTVNVSGTELSISKAIKKIADSSFLEQAFTKDIYFKKNAVSFLSKKLIKLINS